MRKKFEAQISSLGLRRMAVVKPITDHASYEGFENVKKRYAQPIILNSPISIPSGSITMGGRSK